MESMENVAWYVRGIAGGSVKPKRAARTKKDQAPVKKRRETTAARRRPRCQAQVIEWLSKPISRLPKVMHVTYPNAFT